MRYASLVLPGLLLQLGGAGLGQPQAGEERVNPVDGAVMVWVPGTAEACPTGKFRMGSTPQEIDALWVANGWDPAWKELTADEQPAHEVELDGFWLYKHEVTVGQYARFLAATGYPAPPVWDDLQGHADLPVVAVSWDDAAAYCRWAGGALPTEAQWEYAARGPEGRLFPWGNDWDRTRCNSAEYHAGKPLNDNARWHAWYDSFPATIATVVEHLCPAGSFPSGASWCGALDMAGSVWEWCSDWHDDEFYASAAAAQRNPECTDNSLIARALRGGGLDFAALYCRAARRDWDLPISRNNDLGLRPVQAR